MNQWRMSWRSRRMRRSWMTKLTNGSPFRSRFQHAKGYDATRQAVQSRSQCLGHLCQPTLGYPGSSNWTVLQMCKVFPTVIHMHHLFRPLRSLGTAKLVQCCCRVQYLYVVSWREVDLLTWWKLRNVRDLWNMKKEFVSYHSKMTGRWSTYARSIQETLNGNQSSGWMVNYPCIKA